MNNYTSEKILNVCLLSHSKAGKTSIAEAMLFNAGVTDRLGKIADGNTVCDYDPEEIKRKFSISATLATLEWKGDKLNFIDTPGYFDFVGEMLSGIRIADAAIVVVNAKSGVEVGTEIAWNFKKERKLPGIFFINRVDEENVNYTNVLQSLKDKFGKAVAAFQLPIMENGKFVGYADVVDEKAFMFDGKGGFNEVPVPSDMMEDLLGYKTVIAEVVAEETEEFMEKFFSGEPFTHAELVKGIKEAVMLGNLFPVLCGSAYHNLNINTLMDSVIEYLPSAQEAGAINAIDVKKDDEVSLKPEENEALCALVFKTIADPFVGKLSLFRVYSGKIAHDSTVYNSTKEISEKIGHIFVLRGKKQVEVDKISAGDIGAVTKLAHTNTGDTLCTEAKPFLLQGIEFPKPVYSMAVLPKARGDEEKISSGLHKLVDEDPTFSYINNTETHQLVISGLGDQHVDVIISKLKNKFGTSVDLIPPRVSYRETITKKINMEGKHKKQSGGHGQYGHVKIDFEPGSSEDLIFEEKIFGGSVPKNFHPAVEKGLREMLDGGILAGYRVVNLKATLVDGSYHDVDSSEMAFKLAAHVAFKGLTQAGPILLEPIGHLEVTVPDEYTGDVIGDINKRRGRILGMNPGQVVAEVPVSEMFKYAIDLRSMTHGRGTFSFDFERYEQAPPTVTQKVIEEYKAHKTEE